MTFTILAIDPGIHMTGWSVGTYDSDADQLTITNTGMLEASKLAKASSRYDFNHYGNITSLMTYKKEISKLCEKYRPNFITCEDAFYNPRTPNAYLSIKLCIQVIREVLYNQRDVLYLTPPKLAKQITFGKGTADKNDIASAVKSLPNTTYELNKPIDELTEHEYDSIAILYTFCKAHLPEINDIIKKRNESHDFYILITGSRSIGSDEDISRIYAIMDTMARNMCSYKRWTIVHGNARGVDRIIQGWIDQQNIRPVDVQVHVPDWDKHGKAAGMIRNDVMIREVEDKQCICLAFHDGTSSGTKHAMTRSRSRKIPVKVWLFPQKN